MVEDRITDGRRIAQLLASELTGLERGPLGEVAVVDADRDAEPTPEGTFAYGIALGDERLGDVFVYEERARIDLSFGDALEQGSEELEADGLEVTDAGDGLRIHVAYGAAVKRAVDLLVALLDDR